MNNSERIIVALDVDHGEDALRIASEIAPVFPFFKIGIRLFTQYGPEVVRQVLKHGKVFLDLKFHDLPSVVSEAVIQAGRLGVSMMTVHASGGSEMMKLSAEKLARLDKAPLLIGVTMLTSLSSLDEFGMDFSIADQVERLARLAQRAGLNGIVCSPKELGSLRAQFPRPFLMVTPGIRSQDDEVGDQRRTASARAALQAGADYLVIGRPIIVAPNPVAAAEKIAQSLD
jgi:orotidine-5'-phosphate decarboxylase